MMARHGRLQRSYIAAAAALLLVLLALTPAAGALGDLTTDGEVAEVHAGATTTTTSTRDSVEVTVGAALDATAAGHSETVEAEESTGEVSLPAGAGGLLPSLDHEASPSVSTPTEGPLDASATASTSVRHDPTPAGDGASTEGAALVPRGDAWQEEAAVVTGVLTLAGILALFGSSLKAILAQGVAAVMPLFSRLTRSEVLDNDIRASIFEAIRDDPGLCASEVSERVDAAWGTTVYHLQVLEDHHLITSMKHGRHRRFFENGGTHTGRKDLLATLQNDTTSRVLDTVLEEPGLAQKEIAERVDLTPQALAWHMKRLLNVGMVEKERDGRVVRHFPTDDVPIPV